MKKKSVLDLLGPALRKLRRSAGLTQSQLAGIALMSKAQVSRYENGNSVPSLPSLLRFLVAAGAGFADLDKALGALGGRRTQEPGREEAGQGDPVRSSG